MKRFISLLLCLALVFTHIPFSSYAYDEQPELMEEYSDPIASMDTEFDLPVAPASSSVLGGSSRAGSTPTVIAAGNFDDVFSWYLTDDQTLTINGEGEFYYYSYFNKGLFESSTWDTYKEDILILVLGEGITNIDGFPYDNNVYQLSLPASFGEYYFDAYDLDDFDKLQYITVAEENQWYYAEDGMLYDYYYSYEKEYYCKELVYYPNAMPYNSYWLPSDVTSIAPDAIENAIYLSALYLHGNVADIDSYFRLPSSLRLLSLPANISLGSDAFEDSSSIEYILYGGSIDEWATFFAGQGSYSQRNLAEATILYDGETVITGTLTSGLTWSVDFNTNHLSISGQGDMYHEGSGFIHGSLGEFNFMPWSSWYSYLSACLQTVTIHPGVTSIADGAFYRCYSLQSISIPNTVISIGNQAFGGSFTQIDIPASVTEISNYAFINCSFLQTISVADENPFFFDDNGVLYRTSPTKLMCYPRAKGGYSYTVRVGTESIASYAFYGAKPEYIYLPGSLRHIEDYAFITEDLWSISLNSGLETIGNYAFYTGISRIHIPASVTSIADNAFSDCTNLRSITVAEESLTFCGVDDVLLSKDQTILYHYPKARIKPSYTAPDTVSEIKPSAFSNCTTLVDLTLSAALVEVPSSAFRGCTKLTSVNMPSAETIGAAAFSGCFALTTLTLPNNLKIIDNSAFSDCSFLDKVIFPSSVTSIGDHVFEDCVALKTLHLSENLETIGSYTFYGCSALTTLTLPEKVSAIGNFVFEDCTALKTIHLSKDLNTIGNGAFVRCQALEQITVPPENTSFCSVDGVLFTEILQTLIQYPANKPDTAYTIPTGVTSIGNYAFGNCAALTDITLPSGLKTIGNSAFSGCSSLKTLTLKDGVSTIGHECFYSSALTEIVIPESVISIGNNAFSSKLKTVYYTGTEAQWSRITLVGSNYYLGEADIIYNYPSGALSNGVSWAIDWRTGVLTISGEGELPADETPWLEFSSIITAIILQEGIVSAGDGAFSGCAAVQAVTVPISLTTIGLSSFEGCNGLETVRYLGSQAQWSEILIESGNDALTSAELNCRLCNVHTWQEASCTTPKTCSVCGLQEGSSLGHSVVTDQAVAATCTKTGLTEGSHCNRCNMVLLPQTVTPIVPHIDAEPVTENEVSATCTTSGSYDSVIYCAVCNTELSKERIPVSSAGHTEIIDDAKAPTCTESGLTEGKHCSVCSTVLMPQTVLPSFGHTEITDKAKAPTCAETGLTEGKHCSICNTVLVPQTVLSATGHTAGTAVTENVTASSCTVSGSYDRVIYCSVCNAELHRETITDQALGHTSARMEPKAPTCTETGLTEGSYCSVCGVVLTAQTEIPANSHTEGEAVTENLNTATCTTDGSYDAVVYCTVCTAELSREAHTLPASGHTEDPQQTVTGPGYDTCTCSVCGQTYTVWHDERLRYITMPATGLTSLFVADGGYSWVYSATNLRFESGNTRIDSSSSQFSLTLTLAENALLTFAFGVSSESNYDKLTITDTCGEQTVNLVSNLSGTQEGTFAGALSAGTHTLTFLYTKDVSVSNGSDTAWFSGLTLAICPHAEYATETVLPTCTVGGCTRYTCTACGYNYTTDETQALGHSWSEADIDFYRTCSACSTREQVSSISGVTDDGFTWSLSVQGLLTLSGSGVCNDLSAWSVYADRVTGLTLGSGITALEPTTSCEMPNLKTLSLPNTVTEINLVDALEFAPALSSLTVSEANYYFSSNNGVLFNKDQSTLLWYPIGKTDSAYMIPATVTDISDNAFAYNTSLTALFLPAGLETVGSKSFTGCVGLRNMVLDSANPNFTCDNSVALIRKEDDALLLYCHGSLQSSYTVPDGVVCIDTRAFADAVNLKTLSLPLSLDSVEQSAFSGCDTLSTVHYPGTEAYWNYKVDVVSRGNDALTDAAFVYGMIDTLSGTCGENVTWTLELTSGLLTISGRGAMEFPKINGLLSNVYSLWPEAYVRSIVIKEGITALCDYAFRDCTALTEVSLPSSLTTLGRSAFEGCSSLTSITIPERVTCIPPETFENCTALTDVTIPENVTTIGYNAFYNCPLTTMRYTGSEPCWGLVSLEDGNTSLLMAEQVFDSYLLVEWNSSHTVLSLSEKVEDSAYVVAAFYAPDCQVVLAKHYTADEVQFGVGISSSAVNLKACTAKIMVLDEHYAPIGVAYTPDIQKYVYRKAWLYATEHAYIDGGRLADEGTLLFSDGTTVTTVSTAACDLGVWDLGQEYFLTIDPATGEVVSVRLSGGSTTGTSFLYNLEWLREKDNLTTRYSFTIGGVEGTFAVDPIPCLFFTPDGNGIPTTMASQDVYAIAGDAVADRYHAVDKDSDGKIDYLFVQPCLYGKVTKTGAHRTYGPFMELGDASGNALLFDGNSRWYIADDTDLTGSPEEGDFLKLSWDPEKGTYEAEILDPKFAVFEKRSTNKGIYTFSGNTYRLAQNGWLTSDSLPSMLLSQDFMLFRDGELLVYAEPTELIPLDAATMFTDGAEIDEDAKDAVELLYSLDVMYCYTDGSYQPKNTVTRAEMAAMIYRIRNYGEDDHAVNYTGTQLFSDVEPGAWYEGYVNYCAMTMITSGQGDGTFGPNDPITAPEAARMLLCAIGYDPKIRGYTGVDGVKNVLSDAATIGLLDGFKANVNAVVPRQWLAVMIANALTDAYTYVSVSTNWGNEVITENTSAEYVLMGEKYFDLTKNSFIYRQVYSQ